MPLFRKSVSKPASSSSLFRSLHEDLRQAALRGDVDGSLELIKKGAKFVPNKEGRTALHMAAMKGHLDVVRVLIEHGCDLNSQDKLGYTAVHRSVLEGHTETVRVLVEHSVVNVDKQDFVQENTPLHDGAWHGHNAMVEMLLSAKSNVYIRNKTGATALHLACQNGHNRSARLLVQHGCKPDVKDKYDDTPLHTACRYIHAGVTRVLLSANANPNEQNKNGDTPLHLACNLGQKKISRMLLDAGAKPDIKNKQGETSIDIAARKQLSDLVDALKTSTKAQKAICDNSPINGTTTRKSSSKIRDRLLAAKETGSSWQLLFQDWSPYGVENSRTVNSTGHRQYPRLYPIESGFTSPTAVPPLKPIEENGQQYCVDLAGNLRKTPMACYCAPFFYHLAKHNNEAHMELLEEIDACQNNLSNEISDLRQVTERKIDDLNRVVNCRRAFGNMHEQHRPKQGWHRLLSTTKRRLYCAAAAAAVADTPTSAQYPSTISGRLVRSKSESEIETDIERGRANAIADELEDSDSASNASDDLYFDRVFFLRNRTGRTAANLCGTISRSISKPTAPAPPQSGKSPLTSADIATGRTGAPAVSPAAGTVPSQMSYKHDPDIPLDFLTGRLASFDETVRQFNKLESDSFQDSSCTTPTTTGSCSGVSGSHRCTPDTSVRSSIYSSQSACSCLSSSQLSNSKSIQPSLDSGYGSSSVKVENENDVQSAPFPLYNPSMRSPSGPLGPIISNQRHPAQQPQRPKFQELQPTPPRAGVKTQTGPSGRVEAETQTDTKVCMDTHEYTELECILRTATGKTAPRRGHHHQISPNNIKPPPVLPIPPPPRKPLPPLPIDNIDSSPPKRSIQQRSTRYNPTNACLSTNV